MAGFLFVRLTTVIVGMLLVAGCGASTTGSGQAGSSAAPSAADTTNDTSGSGNAEPSDAFIQQQFKQQMTWFAKDVSQYRSDVSAGNDPAVKDDAGLLYSEVSSIPKILSNKGLFGSQAQADLPEVQQAATSYADAYNNINGASGGLSDLEAQVRKTDEQFRAALMAFAGHFGGTVPSV